ncbi:MAG: (Fe-S)-binding protein [Chloroflexi bacterium]|nr:(Fe-S)-binding protein [Chloroflexota bacterium]
MIRKFLSVEDDNLQSCIRCGLCLSVCPTYKETLAEEESPRGRIAIAKAFLEGYLEVTPDLVKHEYSCLLCEACTAICPAGVQMERLEVALRADVNGKRPQPFGERLSRAILYDRLLMDMSLFRFASGFIRVYQRSGLRRFARATGLLRAFGLHKLEGLLPPMRGSFVVPKGQRWLPRSGSPEYRVGLFTGCVMSTVYSSTTLATARVLAANGCEVIAVSGQGCCGSLHFHAADFEGARKLARRNIDAFLEQRVDFIILNSAGCGTLLKHYGELLGDDPDYKEEAAAFARKIKDVTEFLDGLNMNKELGGMNAIVTYQEPCHLSHTQGIRQAPRNLLRSIPGLKLVEMEESDVCCGSAGVYSITNPDMSRRLAMRKIRNALATGADTIASANPGCMLQLYAAVQETGAKLQIKHVVDLLDESYRVARPKEEVDICLAKKQ